MAELSLSELYVYPIKSAAGIALKQAQLTARGLQYDRRWMVVDGKGKFVTQRRFPRMALMAVSIDEAASCLRLRAPGMPEHSVWIDFSAGLNSQGGNGPFEQIGVEIWGDRTTAIAVGPESQKWFSDFIGIDCQLVYMPNNCTRPTAHGKLGNHHLVSFADGYPYLLISEASLSGLNQKLSDQGKAPVTMQRFRPNFVISGVETAHDEDSWQQIKIGEAVFDLPKLCDRCSIPNVDPATGDYPTDQHGRRTLEPTQTLSSYRYWDKGIWFGQNCIQSSPIPAAAKITLHVGEPVKVLKLKARSN
ncbi:MAG: MOSC domain-containing protein [Phormidesmis sp. RL_2_1]|nr:MOSC domain-containing protein [Phormidesmis sp. RL_2_1]